MPGINTGSTADIAFLLLVFFLLVTTIDLDKGILRMMAPLDDTIRLTTISEKDALCIVINGLNEYEVEGEKVGKIELLRTVNQFYLNGGVFEDSEVLGFLPTRLPLSAERINKSLDRMNMEENGGLSRRTIEAQKITFELLGDVRILPSQAVIVVSVSDSSAYEAYVEVMDEVNVIVADFRRELCLQRFGRNYDELDEVDPEERRMLECPWDRNSQSSR
jgi:biopolymer transport protein ExbD